MQKTKKSLLLTAGDYDMIHALLKDNTSKRWFNREEAEDLQEELKKATVVSRETIPLDVVMLYSQVTIREEGSKQLRSFTIVPPAKADIAKMKISVFSPMGTALIGYAKGEKVQWRVPAGLKTFRIVEVEHPLN
ncbi:MAG: GreA/GreB family elongation factor [Chitinophagaceae bacterium]|nr:GreA/GreB family elongation factor [Chitinophagaceae bacterium]